MSNKTYIKMGLNLKLRLPRPYDVRGVRNRFLSISGENSDL
jgi:hypothetical protein